MAIKVEQIEENGQVFDRTYSDAHRYVVRDGISYEEACDPVNSGRTYTEGDLISTEDPEIRDKAEAYDILMGVSE